MMARDVLRSVVATLITLHSIISVCESKTIISLSIPYNAPVGSVVTTLKDVDPHSVVEPLDQDGQNFFDFHQKTGAIVTSADLTHLVEKVIPLRHTNRASGLSQTIQVRVASSSHLVFPQAEYVGTIYENEPVGSDVKITGHLTASSPLFKNVRYKIISDFSRLFKLENVSHEMVHELKLRTSSSFDREIKSLHTVLIEAKSEDGQVASATVQVHVLDVNDNTPVFENDRIRVKTASDQVWGSLVTLQATDADSNDHLHYHLEGSPDFAIDSKSGELYTEGDFIHPGSYRVRVYAVDAAGHKSAPASVFIEVEGSPLLYKAESHFHHIAKRAVITKEKVYEIMENSTSTSSLFSIASVQTRPQNSAEEYALVSYSVDLFRQPDVNGNVYLKPGARLDYEQADHRTIILTFNRTNRNTPEDYTLIKVTLRVQDKNDEKPVFKNQPVPFLATVSTNPGMSEAVYTLYAEDPDTTAELVYNLESGGEGKFRMVTERDPDTGDMVGKIVTTVSGPGQFVEGMEYTLVVSAQDTAGVTTPQKSDFALVKILVGLRPPQLFHNPYIAQVYENSGTDYKIMGEDGKILVVRAKCFQDELENDVKFDLIDADSQASGMFSINNLGQIKTLQNLDYEEFPNQYILNITALETKSDLMSSAQLIVNVLDVNDNSPKFSVSTYTFTVSESVAVGRPLSMLVTATDKDSGKNGQLVYSVSDDHFEIETRLINNEYVGSLKLAKRLDYDFQEGHQYMFNVTATDMGEVPRFGSATVFVYVLNVNDEEPVFGSGVDHLYASISEEQARGSVVTIIQATDPDGDNVKYYFTPKNTMSPPFKIDPDSGLITLMQMVPETIPFYALNITAYDDGSCCGSTNTLSSETYIVVEIKDTNNNQPTFPSCKYESEVMENQPAGTFVVQVTAEDNDRGANGNITYSIVTSPFQQKLFDVDPVSGRVVTAVRFDREEGDGRRGYSVTVKAADQGHPQSLDSHCVFWVWIGDQNDNNPVFDSPSYSTSISESEAGRGRRVFTVRATDEDLGAYGDVIYSLHENPGDFFRIESDSGIIYLENPLHSTNQVVLQVKAEDKGDPPLTAFTTVTISITDRQSKPPTWDSDSYELQDYLVKETAPIGYAIATFSASSNLESPFDGVTFALIDSQGRPVQGLGPFSLWQEDNRVIIKLRGVLDYNIKNRYELRLRVTNQGKNPLSEEIRPVIVVDDANNQPPQFEGLDPNLSNSYKASVPENEQPGHSVITVIARDSDHDYPNQEVTYSLYEDKNKAFEHFSIDATTGAITTRSRFDREEQSVYYIKVMAIDGAPSEIPFHQPPGSHNTATAQVQVMIADKNDNPPYFTQPFWTTSIPEQRADDSGRILTVTAMDLDEADSLAYSIIGGNIGNVFGIRQKTGDIYVAKNLDYETPPTNYNLTVMVLDGPFNSTAYVDITVTDINDNPPVFSQQTYEITDVVEETVPPSPEGQFLVQVSATDQDISRQSNFRFSLSGDGTSPPDATFTIEPSTGRIYLRKKLDRDLPNGRPEYQFNVIAEDEPNTPTALYGYAYVKIRPKDINDNDPTFSETELQGYVQEHSPAGQSVMTVVARDPDAGQNGTVLYEIDRYGSPPADPRTQEGLFQINSQTGLITTNLDNTLDREKIARYFLQIIAKDGGLGADQRSSTATVTINIVDINDQVPKFVQKIYRVSMSENQIAGPVITVSATDNDIDENARLTYRLKKSDSTYFGVQNIPPNAGVLTVYEAVDYETTKFFNLTVYVQDNDPDHVDEAYIEVDVEDFNDNAPEFDVKVKTIKKEENIPEGTSLWNCSASDSDSGVNAEFEYMIDRTMDEGRRFTVNSNCEVKVRRGLDGQTLDREALAGLPEEKYEVHILAVDKGFPRQTGTALLRIFVTDLNDNFPELVLPHPPIVMEEELPPTHVVTFSARDRDTPKYGAPFYFALPPCNPPDCDENDQDFTLVFDPMGDNKNGTGTVTAQRTFYRDQQKYHYLPIITSDMRGRESNLSMTGTNTLTIEIGDINNNPHRPGHKDIFVYKYDFKGIDKDLVIGNVYAEDPDDWDVKDKHFYFVGPPTMAKYFSVDYDDGLIRMNKKTPAGVHQFTAKVWDFRVFTSINATATVTVTVEEITDEAIFSSGSLRLSGITAEEFVQKPPDKPDQMSPYEKFQKLIAFELKVNRENVAIFSVMNSKDKKYTDIRYAAHGSPYYQPSKLNGIVSVNKDRVESNVGIKIAMVNIDMCLREVCDSGGCSNILEVGDHPNYVNTNGTSFIGIATSVRAECQCAAQDFKDPVECYPGYCYNGGTCVKDDWGDLSCIDCQAQFDGPRCQMTKHSFQGGYAVFEPFTQCEESVTSIEFVTTKDSGLIFYNGPVEELGRDDPSDFIALELQDGYPKLQLDHGSGLTTIQLDGRDQLGIVVMQKLNDGRWHHIDIIRNGKEVTLIVDRCAMIEPGMNGDRRPCEVTGSTPGENYYLNVNTLLQLGGRYAEDISYPATVTSAHFIGCVRNLVHNGKLYDLYTGRFSVGENHLNGCPDEDQLCGINTIEGRQRCGKFGICEMTDMINQQYKCTCRPGYRTTTALSQQCDTETTVRDLKMSSFMSWELKPKFFSRVSLKTTDIQLRFRTRDENGILFHLPSNTDKFITLEIVGGRVQVLYNLGDGKAKGDGDHVLSLAHAPASNGQWHTVVMHRIGKWVQLKMDGGEGRYYNETWGPVDGRQEFSVKFDQIVAGAYVVFSKVPIANGQDLNSTCIDDIRLNNDWFPMMISESDFSPAAEFQFESNVDMDCVRDDCKNVKCPTGVPYSMVCYELWGTFDCRCPPGNETDGYNCVPIDFCERHKPCFIGSSCIPKPHPTYYTCVCPTGWTGPLCNLLAATEVASASLTVGFIIVIIVSIFAILLGVVITYLVIRYRSRKDPISKYILDPNDEDDIRENVVNYDEEGAGEEDQNAFDINRLRKPEDGEPMGKLIYDPLTAERYPKRGAGPEDRPDVGSFIHSRLNDADEDPGAPPHDSVREFVYEGGGSDVGSLSSLNTSSSVEDQDYDCLNDWGPKFSKLATMYGGDDED